MKHKHKFRSSIKNKVFLLLLSALIIPIASLSLLFCSIFVRDSKASYVTNNVNLIENVNDRLYDYMSQLDTISRFVVYDDTQLTLNNEWEIYNNVMQRLLYTYGQRSEIDSIFYYFPAKKELYVISRNGNRSYLNAGRLEEMEWYQELESGQDSYTLSGQHLIEEYGEWYPLSSESPVFSINKKFRAGNGEKSFLSINFKQSYLKKICENTLLYPSESIQYLNKYGDVIYASGMVNNDSDRAAVYQRIQSEEKMEGSFTHVLDAEGMCTIIYRKTAFNGTILYKCISNKVLQQHVKNIIYVGIATFSIAVKIQVPLGNVLTNKITRPLIEIEEHMKRMGEGDLEVRVPVKSEDEIGRISRSFNQMAEQIYILINEQYRLKLAYRTSQLQSLIAQINPHFINNTLQAISGVALERGVKEIYVISSTLGKMLYYSIKEKDIVTLQRELQNASDYLSIQKFRYEERLQYTIEDIPEASQICIPKLILQPLVENAVTHGMEGKKDMLSVTVRVTSSKERLYFEIADNGQGMNQEKLNELSNLMEKNKEKIEIESAGIGLINVYQRLYLTYERELFMEIESETGKGTFIRFSVPIKEEWTK